MAADPAPVPCCLLGLGGAADAEHEGAEMVGLPALVREIQRIDTIQLYAEATLQLEALVGNLEDVTFSIVRHASKLSLPSILWKSNEHLEDASDVVICRL
ncbi:unnamed protein product [Urochloa humidicola]